MKYIIPTFSLYNLNNTSPKNKKKGFLNHCVMNYHIMKICTYAICSIFRMNENIEDIFGAESIISNNLTAYLKKHEKFVHNIIVPIYAYIVFPKYIMLLYKDFGVTFPHSFF